MNLAGAMSSDNRIRIITNAGIRYEGRLYEINPKERTIALQDVTSFGSEDRRKDQVIPPMQVKYECIVFDAADIKDIRVLTKEETEKYEVKSNEKTKEAKSAPQTPAPAPQTNQPPQKAPESVQSQPIATTKASVKTEVAQKETTVQENNQD